MTTNPYKTPTHKRPATAAEVAAWAGDLREFGYNHADWLHELAKVHSRTEFLRRIESPAPSMAGKFSEGDVADASLAAEIEYLCAENGVSCPAWVIATPAAGRAWFQRGDDPWARAQAIQESPAPFRQRNIFYVPWFKLALRAGRPKADAAALRKKAAERNRRYRKKLLKEAGRTSSD